MKPVTARRTAEQQKLISDLEAKIAVKKAEIANAFAVALQAVMSERCRVALVLRNQGWTYRSIGEVFGVKAAQANRMCQRGEAAAGRGIECSEKRKD